MNPDEQLAMARRSRDSWVLPGAILAAGLLIAIFVYQYRVETVVAPQQADLTKLRPVDGTDHLLGSPDAPIKLIEYADIDSSYAKTFQSTMEQVMSEYAAGGKVAWVYRHLPLIDQHIYSAQHAEAAECVASLGGQNMFWRFINALNASAPGSLQFNPANYGPVIASLGIVQESFDACMEARTFQSRVARDFDDGFAIGAGGSPFTILLAEGQPPVTIDGGIPYASLKQIIDTALARLPAN